MRRAHWLTTYLSATNGTHITGVSMIRWCYLVIKQGKIERTLVTTTVYSRRNLDQLKQRGDICLFTS